MTLDPAQLPDDIATLKAMVIAAEKKASDRGLEIEALKLTIAKLQRSTFGASSESGKKLLDQLELQLAELEHVQEDQEAIAIAFEDKSAEASSRITLFLATKPALQLKAWIAKDAQGFDTRTELSDLMKVDAVDQQLFNPAAQKQ